MFKPFEVIFSDQYLLVLNKIAKILVQPSYKNEKFTLTSLLEQDIKQKVYPCHRLDRETTGLIIYALNKEIQRNIMEQFKKRKVIKRYIALVKGELPKKEGVIEGYILDREGKKFKEKPKKAKTFYKVKETNKEYSVVELEPITGRTNQLRIQLAKLGNPILGERKYAFGKDFKIKLNRLALHSYFLSFIHPISNERLNLKIPLPQEIAKFLKNPI